jgi:glyoxylase-like metal-dependent hydrolase (beta-lactamase superfamily II)
MSDPTNDRARPAPGAGFAVGDWTIHAVEAEYLGLDGGSMFGSVPKPMWSKLQPPDARNRIRLATRCMLLVGHGRTILVDDGMGSKLAPKLMDIYDVEAGDPLAAALQHAGVGVEDVTDVVLTHLHFDHAGGSTRLVDGRLVPRFPRARYYVQRKNLDNARRPNPRERASYLPENFEPLAEAGMLDTWEGAGAPWPGVEVFTADGHTRGQQLLRVHGGGRAVYYVADLIPTASHVRIPFVMGYDMAAIETMEEKRAMLARAAAENAWVLIEHDPRIAWGRPQAEGDDFGWADTVESPRAAVVTARASGQEGDR